MSASPPSRICTASSCVRIPPTAKMGMETAFFAAEKNGRFHTGAKGYVFAARLYPQRRTRILSFEPPSATWYRRLIDSVSSIEDGYPPRHSDPWGNTDKPTGVMAW